MKRNAITRIVIHSIVALVLTGILFAGIAAGELSFRFDIGDSGATVIDEEFSVEASKIKNLEIEWAAGSLEIRTADTDQITVSESRPEDTKYKMTYQISGNTLKLDYASGTVTIGFGSNSIPKKDLIVTVPKDWVGGELEIDGAALDIQLQDLNVESIDLDGAACALSFCGSLNRIEIDGASADITLNCTNRISSINVDGASCDLDVSLPKDCGFQVAMDGLSCSFHSDLDYSSGNGSYSFGDQHCKVNVDGISCNVTISESGECAHVWDEGEVMTIPGNIEQEMVYHCTLCGSIKSEPIYHTKHIWNEGTLVGGNTMVYSCTVCGEVRTLTITDPEPERHGFIWMDWETRKLLEDQIFEAGYFEGAEIVFKTEIFEDRVLELYCDGEFICGPTVVGDHWEFYFTMPNHVVYIELKATDAA